MKKTFTKLNLFIASLLLVFATLTAGFADWVYSQPTITKTVEAIDDKEEPVAYIDTDETKFYTIEDALSKATALSNNGNTAVTVYVKPWINGVCTTATIKKDCVITKNVSLVLPYDGTDSMSRDTTSGSFADRDANAVKTNRASNISIADGITLTNNGTLTIGGQLGAGGSPNLNGQTAGKFSQITMNSSSKIISNGTLNVYGYVKRYKKETEAASVEVYGTAYVPMVMYDFKGGSYTATNMIYIPVIATSHNVFPVSEYDFPNIQCETKISSTAKYNALYDIYASDSHVNGNISLIESSDGLFRFSSGYLTMNYTPTSWDANGSYTTDNRIKWTSKIKIYGSCSFNSLEITIKVSVLSYNVDSSDYFLPLCYKFDIEICSGATFTVNKDVKVMTGARLTIDHGAIANINASVSCYSSFEDKSQNARYPSYDSAELIVNGNLNINGSFGGNISTSQEGAVVFTGNSFSNSVSTKEMNGSDQSNHSETAYAMKKSGSAIEKGTIESGITYLSEYDSAYYWASLKLSVSATASPTSVSSEGSTILLTASLSPDNKYFDLTNAKWSITSKDSSASNNNTITNDTSLSAKFNVTKKPDNGWFGSKTTWTYKVQFTIKSIYGNMVQSEELSISVTSK